MAHECEAAVGVCIDFRFQEIIREWTDKHLKGEKFDLIAIAGSVKNLQQLMEQVDISKRLHHIKRLVLINHEDCGAYGAEGTIERHTQDLRKARQEIAKKYPDIRLDTLYLHLDGQMDEIN